MKVVLHGEQDLELHEFGDPGFNLELESADVEFGALEMFATSLGVCTYSVLAVYGQQLDIGSEAIHIRLRWSYTPKTPRIDHIDMAIDWPELPPHRLDAAQRVAAKCTLHRTLEQPPRIDTQVYR